MSEGEKEVWLMATSRLKRAAVRWSILSKQEQHTDSDASMMLDALSELQKAADAFTESLQPSMRDKFAYGKVH